MLKYTVIVADPPWRFDDELVAMKRNVKRSASSQYDVLTIADIAALPVSTLADPTCSLLVLWVPSSMIQDGLNVMQSWGYTYKQTFVWVKLKKDALLCADANDAMRMGMGRTFRQAHEIALIGTIGQVSKNLQDRAQRSVLIEEPLDVLSDIEGETLFDLNLKHSRKPDGLQERLEKMLPNSSRLELFARRQRLGWDCVGNEIDGRDIREVLQELIMR